MITMLKSLVAVDGNGRVDPIGAEQQNCLSEQRGAYRCHRQRPTGRRGQVRHAEGRATNFARRCDRRCGCCRPCECGALDACLRDERPEHYQRPRRRQIALRHHGTMSTEACEVEISAGDAAHPKAHTLA
jgi:hypothetical protein